MMWRLDVSLGSSFWAVVVWQDPGDDPLEIRLVRSLQEPVLKGYLQGGFRRLEGHPLGDLLRAYGAGEPVDPASYPLGFSRGTPFQQRVWQETRGIARGAVATYGALAERIGKVGAARAVGGALHVNPWPLLVPCHRVVARGGPGGFAPGLELKRRLWCLEGREEV